MSLYEPLKCKCYVVLCFPSDPTLTTSKIMEVMKEKEWNWNILGRGLDIPRSKRDDIRRHYQTDLQCMQASLDYWERTHPAPSWKKVAEALQRVGEDTLAEEVTTKYVRGMCGNVCRYIKRYKMPLDFT